MGLFSSGYDLSGSGFDLSSTSVFGSSGALPSGVFSSNPAAAPSGIFDLIERGSSVASNLLGQYFTYRAQTNPERVVEYDDVPRNFDGGAVNSRGVGLSWQVVALAGLAAVAYLALKKS